MSDTDAKDGRLDRGTAIAALLICAAVLGAAKLYIDHREEQMMMELLEQSGAAQLGPVDAAEFQAKEFTRHFVQGAFGEARAMMSEQFASEWTAAEMRDAFTNLPPGIATRRPVGRSATGTGPWQLTMDLQPSGLTAPGTKPPPGGDDDYHVVVDVTFDEKASDFVVSGFSFRSGNSP